MTKQEIKDLIAAKIAGQGNQVDIGGKLAEILGAIVDSIGSGGEPIIVEGTVSDGEFHPNSGQPTKADAIEAVKDGRMVIVKIPSEDDETKWDWHYLQFFYEFDSYFYFSGAITWE